MRTASRCGQSEKTQQVILLGLVSKKPTGTSPEAARGKGGPQILESHSHGKQLKTASVATGKVAQQLLNLLGSRDAQCARWQGE